MRLLIRSVITFAAAVFISNVGFVTHVAAQPTMASMMHHSSAGSSSLSCVMLCNSAPISSKEKDPDSEKANDDGETMPSYIATTGQGVRASSMKHTSVSRYITSLEPPPPSVKPHILFAVFRT